MDVIEKSVLFYRTAGGLLPFAEWMGGLRDRRARQKILARLARVRSGNLGHVASVGKGVHELKIDYGPGYRIYFGQSGAEFIILLLGGDKKTQGTDIPLLV
jgi:putative addiction module killer protein